MRLTVKLVPAAKLFLPSQFISVSSPLMVFEALYLLYLHQETCSCSLSSSPLPLNFFICLKMYAVVNLTLVDLPGLTKVAVGK